MMFSIDSVDACRFQADERMAARGLSRSFITCSCCQWFCVPFIYYLVLELLVGARAISFHAMMKKVLHDHVYSVTCSRKEDLENASIGSNPIVWNVLSPDSGIEDDTSRTSSTCSQPRLYIVDEPESNYRFRYARESRKPHGPIKSKSSANVPKNISHGPRVKLLDYEGEAIIRGWLFQGSLQPGKTLGPSPNCLVKTKGRGQTDLFYEPHDIVVNQSNDYTASFDNYNILHVVKSEKNYQKLYLKKKRSVAPRLGSLYVRNPPEVPDDYDKEEVIEDFKSSEKNICCLYFEAFGKCGDDYVLLCRQLSSPIRNIKNAENNLLKIVKQSHVDGPCSGGTEVLIFTEKLIKDIKIIFFEDDWQAEGSFKESDIHKRVALSFKTPPYHDQLIEDPVTVCFVMLRTHDGEMSEPHEFRYLPRTSSWMPEMKRKRPISRTSCKDPFLLEAIIGDSDPLLSKTEDDMLGASSLEEGVSTGDLFKAPVILDDLFDEHLVADSFHHERPVIQGETFKADTNIDPIDVDPTLQLRFFTEMGMPQVVKSYLAMGGDPYALDDRLSNTAIHSAILKPSLICLQILLRSVQPKSVFNIDGDDPVLHAVRYKKVEALKLLLLKGFSSCSSNVKNGDTPLHVAVENELFDAIDLLIQHGACVSDCNYAGTSVLEYARATKNEEMLRKLLPYVESVDEHDGIDKLMETLDITDNKTDDSDENESATEEEESINNERANIEGGEVIPNDEATLEETLAALDGDVQTSLEVANLLGCGFLAPILKNAQRQSCILLNYLKMKETHENAVAVLSRYTLAVKANIPKS